MTVSVMFLTSCKRDSVNLGSTHSPLQHLPNMCRTHQESALWSCVCASGPFLHVCVRHDVATPCPVQTRSWLCRQPRRQAWLATGTRCAWHPAEGEGRSTAGPGRLQHLSHRAKGPSGGALNTRTGPERNDNEDQDCVTQDNT